MRPPARPRPARSFAVCVLAALLTTFASAQDAPRQTFQRLVEEKRYEEAIEIAAQIVAATTRLHGERSVEIVSPLADLATAQLEAGRLADAETNYRAAIALAEREDGPGSPRLVNPLVGLGETYLRGGFAQQANDAFQRALQVNHAAAGFYNLEQMKVLDGLSESYLALDKIGEANARQRQQVAIQRRRAGGETPELTAALYKLGRWYSRTGQYPEAREAYQQARRIARESGGENDPAQVDALLGEALAWGNEGEAPMSVATLKRALEILDAQPERDRLKRAEVLVAIGDLHVVYRKPSTAHARYAEAWRDLSGEPSLTTQRDEYFARPSRITGPRLPGIVGERGEERATPREEPGALAPGFVVARFTVAADGGARDAAIVESEPPGLMDTKVLRALAASSFRPRLEDGGAVATTDVQFRHEFRYTRAARAADEPSPPAGEVDEPIAYPGTSDDAAD